MKRGEESLPDNPKENCLINCVVCRKCRMPNWWYDTYPTSCRFCQGPIMASKPKTADKQVATPKGKPHNKMHSKNYTPDVAAPKTNDPEKR